MTDVTPSALVPSNGFPDQPVCTAVIGCIPKRSAIEFATNGLDELLTPETK